MNFTEKLNEELQLWEKMGEEEITNLIEPTSQQLAELNQKKIRQYNLDLCSEKYGTQGKAASATAQ